MGRQQSDLAFQRFDTAGARTLRDTVELVYCDTYADRIASGGTFESAEALIVRLARCTATMTKRHWPTGRWSTMLHGSNQVPLMGKANLCGSAISTRLIARFDDEAAQSRSGKIGYCWPTWATQHCCATAGHAHHGRQCHRRGVRVRRAAIRTSAFLFTPIEVLRD